MRKSDFGTRFFDRKDDFLLERRFFVGKTIFCWKDDFLKNRKNCHTDLEKSTIFQNFRSGRNILEIIGFFLSVKNVIEKNKI